MASDKFTLPEGFMLGTGSSAYQIEGAWNADNKAPSIWDHYFHTKNFLVSNPGSFLTKPQKKKFPIYHKGTDLHALDAIRGYSFVNGDIACDSYNKLDEDIKNLVELGVNTYRFSISWPRVLPFGDDRTINNLGVQYYQKLIKKLKDNKITPVVTIYHWDLPVCLQELGGWANPKIIEYFANYSDFLFKTFGADVKLWTTINEPRLVAFAYGNEGMAPSVGETFNGIAEYMVIRNLLLAHAKAYRLYEKHYAQSQKGEISICVDTAAYFPKNPELEADKEAVDKAFNFMLGVFTQPLVDGTFPKSLLDSIAKTNKQEKITKHINRIVEFTEEEKTELKNSYDFIAFNYYDSFKVQAMTEAEYKEEGAVLNKDLGVILSPNSDNIKETFDGFTQVVKWLVDNVKNPKLFIAENGIAEKANEDSSALKIEYHHGILTELDKALKEGVVITGYCVWSFMDSLEWTSGYFSKLFGIYAVDFNDPKRTRSKKKSFDFFETLFKEKKLLAIESKK